MKDLHAISHQRLHNRDTAGQRRKSKGQEKRNAHKASNPAHGSKHLGQTDKGQTGAAGHTIGAQEHIDRRDDHHSGQDCHTGIENLNLIVGLVQIHIVLHIAAIGDHDPHADAQGEEQLTHGVQYYI